MEKRFVAMGLLKRKKGMSVEEFQHHWLNVHGPLAAQFPGVKSYVQNHVIHAQAFDRAGSAGTYYDGVSMLEYESEEARAACMESEAFKAAVADEANFIGHLDFLYTDRLVVQPLAVPEEGAIKRMSFITRNPSMTPERFRFEWQYFHAALIRDEIPEVIGYNQNWVDMRFSPRGRAVDASELPIDGVVELWFKNEADVDKAFSYESFGGRALSLHTKVLVGSVTPYLVKQHRII